MHDIGGGLVRKKNKKQTKEFPVPILQDSLSTFSAEVLKLSEDQAQGFPGTVG